VQTEECNFGIDFSVLEGGAPTSASAQCGQMVHVKMRPKCYPIRILSNSIHNFVCEKVDLKLGLLISFME
jgi:hypothetical protein